MGDWGYIGMANCIFINNNDAFTSKPRVSIIVPVYNVEKYIHRCIDSILNQTFTDFECILVNDCTPDSSGNICNEYAKIDKRIKVIHKNKNEGSSQARKTGLKNSFGEYIQFIDSDDWIESDMLEKLYQKAISENYDITVCAFFKENGSTSKIIEQCFSNSGKTDMIKEIISFRSKIYGEKRVGAYVWNKFVKRNLLLLVKFPVDSRSEDYVITIQNIYNSNRIGYVNIPLYHYCHNATSLSSSKERKILGHLEENRNWRNVIDFLREKYGDLKIFEPDLRNRANSLKEKYMLDKNLRNIKELFKLYPESKFFRRLIVKVVIKMLIQKFFTKEKRGAS